MADRENIQFDFEFDWVIKQNETKAKEEQKINEGKH